MSSEHNVEAAIRACHTNASHLIRSARLLVDHGGLMSAAYHLALLAIEETGKASLLRINWLNLLLGQARPSIDRKLDDHFQKLFYAFFLSAAFGQRLSKEDVDNAKLLASAMHQKRLGSLYVSHTEDGQILEIPPQEAEQTIHLAEARLALEEDLSHEVPDPHVIEALNWLFETIADEERKKFVFSRQSIHELDNGKSVLAWVQWIREQFAAQEIAFSLRFMARGLRFISHPCPVFHEPPGDSKSTPPCPQNPPHCA